MKQVYKDWVVALRSGTYLQGKGALQRDSPLRVINEYCCLGVLCSLKQWDGSSNKLLSTMEIANSGLSIGTHGQLKERFHVLDEDPFDDVRGGEAWALTVLNDWGCTFD